MEVNYFTILYWFRHMSTWLEGSPWGKGFLGGTSGKESACQCRKHREEVWPLRQEDPLEEEMVTHSSILAWKIPWTEEPGGLRSTGSQSREQLSTRHSTHTRAGEKKSRLCRPSSVSVAHNSIAFACFFWFSLKSFKNVEPIPRLQAVQKQVGRIRS